MAFSDYLQDSRIKFKFLELCLQNKQAKCILAIFFQNTIIGCQHAIPFLLLEYDIESYKALSNNIAFKTKIPGQQGHTQS